MILNKSLLSTIVKVLSENTHFKMSSSDDLPSDIENKVQEENIKKHINVTKNGLPIINALAR